MVGGWHSTSGSAHDTGCMLVSAHLKPSRPVLLHNDPSRAAWLARAARCTMKTLGFFSGRNRLGAGWVLAKHRPRAATEPAAASCSDWALYWSDCHSELAQCCCWSMTSAGRRPAGTSVAVHWDSSCWTAACGNGYTFSIQGMPDPPTAVHGTGSRMLLTLALAVNISSISAKAQVTSGRSHEESSRPLQGRSCNGRPQ